MHIKKNFIFVLVLVFITSVNLIAQISKVSVPLGKKLTTPVFDLIENHCMECHDEETQRGGINLESLFENLKEGKEGLWIKALQAIDEKNMPLYKKKKDKDKVKITEDERKQIISNLDTSIIDYYENYKKINNGFGILRRISNYEYLRFLKTVFDYPIEEIKDLLPKEDNASGFNNQADFLRISSGHFQIYENIANKVAEYTKKMGLIKYTKFFFRDLQIKNDRQTKINLQNTYAGMQQFHKDQKKEKIPNPERIAYSGFLAKNYKKIGIQFDKNGYILLMGNNRHDPIYWCSREYLNPVSELRFKYDFGMLSDRKYFKTKLAFPDGPPPWIPIKGYYDVEIIAFANYLGKRFKYGIPLHIGQRSNLTGRAENLAQTIEILKTIGIKNQNLKTYKIRSYFKEGPLKFQVTHGRTFPYQMYNLMKAKNIYNQRKDPYIAIKSIAISGPIVPNNISKLFDGLPKAKISRKKISTNVKFNRQQFNTFIKRLCSKAFRIPEELVDVDRYYDFYKKIPREKNNFSNKINIVIKSVLLSPRFLYYKENPNQLSNYQIASRMSTFIWGESPDSQLLKIAKASKLTNPQERKNELARMLKNPKSEFFKENFPYQWLDLAYVGDTVPSKESHPNYNNHYQAYMRQETILFFKKIFDEDLDITNLIDSNWTMANNTLAKLYGLKKKKDKKKIKEKIDPLAQKKEKSLLDTSAFSRYTFPNKKTKSYRGGLIGQASFLSITSNGTTTRPVKRGAWIVQKFLGAEIEPPPNVPAINVDTRIAKSLVQLMDVHRDNPGCKSCHQKFDSLGIALEKLDVIGKVRNRYWIDVNKTLPIKTKVFSPDGVSMQYPIDVRAYLLRNKKKFTINLITQIFNYALGRKMNYFDSEKIKKMADNLIIEKEAKICMKDIMLAVIESDIFIKK